MRSTRTLANDVTVSGAEEPDVFALELFEGDGATTVFDLTRDGFRVKGKALVDEGFTLSALNPQVWQVNDPGSHLTLGSGGLSISGGTGVDGQTVLEAIDPVELGGSLVAEAGGVQFAAGSNGIVCGLYSGAINLGDCVAGFRVRTSGGALLLVAIVNGSEAGTIFTMTPGHLYTLRIRLHLPEVVRCLATYYSLGSGGVVARGGGLTGSPGAIEFELQDSASAPNTPATVLYDSLLGSALSAPPAVATFAAVNSIALNGSVSYITADAAFDGVGDEHSVGERGADAADWAGGAGRGVHGERRDGCGKADVLYGGDSCGGRVDQAAVSNIAAVGGEAGRCSEPGFGGAGRGKHGDPGSGAVGGQSRASRGAVCGRLRSGGGGGAGFFDQPRGGVGSNSNGREPASAGRRRCVAGRSCEPGGAIHLGQ